MAPQFFLKKTEPHCSLISANDSLELEKTTHCSLKQHEIFHSNFLRTGQDNRPRKKSTVVTIQDVAITTQRITEKPLFSQKTDFLLKNTPKQLQVSRKIRK